MRSKQKDHSGLLLVSEVRITRAGKRSDTYTALRWRELDSRFAGSLSDVGHPEREMLSLIVTLLIIALIAAVLGFGGIAGAAVGIAKVVFFVFLVLFLISLVVGGFRGYRWRL